VITNLYILFLAIAKAAVLTGIGPAAAIVIVLELRGVRIVAIGIEQVSSAGQLAAIRTHRASATSPAAELEVKAA